VQLAEYLVQILPPKTEKNVRLTKISTSKVDRFFSSPELALLYCRMISSTRKLENFWQQYDTCENDEVVRYFRLLFPSISERLCDYHYFSAI
jgi:hypothetical protein